MLRGPPLSLSLLVLALLLGSPGDARPVVTSATQRAESPKAALLSGACYSMSRPFLCTKLQPGCIGKRCCPLPAQPGWRMTPGKAGPQTHALVLLQTRAPRRGSVVARLSLRVSLHRQ
jgi:hypothetical protein